MIERKFDLKLIPELNTSAFEPSMVERIEKAKLVFKINEMKNLKLMIPLWVMSREFVVYQQLWEEKEDFS